MWQGRNRAEGYQCTGLVGLWALIYQQIVWSEVWRALSIRPWKTKKTKMGENASNDRYWNPAWVIQSNLGWYKENEQLQTFLQSRLFLATLLQVHTHYNGQDLFWEVDDVEQMLAFELDILVKHAVTSASTCDCKVDLGANFSLNAKKKKKKKCWKRKKYLPFDC